MSTLVKEKKEGAEEYQTSGDVLVEPRSGSILENAFTKFTGEESLVLSPEANKWAYYRRLGILGDELLKQWQSIQDLSFPVYTLSILPDYSLSFMPRVLNTALKRLLHYPKRSS